MGRGLTLYTIMYKSKDLKDNLLAGSMSAVNKVEFIDEISSDPVKASVTLTMDTKPTATDTLTIGARTYTFQDTLTDVDGNVFIGATLVTAKANLLSAFTLSGTAGTAYAASMTVNSDVKADPFDGSDASLITAVTAGNTGNALVSTETFTAGTNVFDTVTLVGGEDSIINVASLGTGATYTNDTTAAAGGVPIGGIYRVTTTGVVQWRVS